MATRPPVKNWHEAWVKRIEVPKRLDPLDKLWLALIVLMEVGWLASLFLIALKLLRGT